MNANDGDTKNSLRPSLRLCNKMLSCGENILNHKNIIHLSITVKEPLFGHDHLSTDKKYNDSNNYYAVKKQISLQNADPFI